MLGTMEKFKQTLEELVEERSEELQREKNKTDKLLYSLMPKYVYCRLYAVL